MREDAPPTVDPMIAGERRCMKNSKIIALDCDGVLLDYGLAYGDAWSRAFSEAPILYNPNAYWPIDRWNVPTLSGQALEQLRSAFDEVFWSSIPAIDGALEACQLLVNAGYELVCVTAISDLHLPARRHNLEALGFPIADVIATANEASRQSPKAFALNALNCTAFVEDFAPYLVGVDETIHKALILRDPDGSPNVGQALELANSTHGNLSDFAHWWCGALNGKAQS